MFTGSKETVQRIQLLSAIGANYASLESAYQQAEAEGKQTKANRIQSKMAAIENHLDSLHLPTLRTLAASEVA